MCKQYLCHIQLNIFLKPVEKIANGFEDFCVQIRKQLSCKMKDLQLSVNNVDQCSSIFNHKDFSHAASLDLNFQTLYSHPYSRS